ncbi:hypothetical protein L1279_002855 [Planomicrobium sp. HSC-17F08]|nr:hypothetical protein [Planomicrobium sp. HSC-17F08]
MKKNMFLFLFAAAAILLVLFSFQSDIWNNPLKESVQSEDGLSADGNKVEAGEKEKEGKAPTKENYEEEKEVVVQIEGMEEKVIMHLNKGKDCAYVIYIDEERYKMVSGEGDNPDAITTKEALPENFPEVSMTIEHVPDTAPEVLVEEFEAELKVEFPDLREVEQVTEPVEGYQLHGIANGGQQWNDPVVHAYVFSNGQSGSFVITERYFLEAAEGHGARFYAMLTEFHIVEPE